MWRGCSMNFSTSIRSSLPRAQRQQFEGCVVPDGMRYFSACFFSFFFSFLFFRTQFCLVKIERAGTQRTRGPPAWRGGTLRSPPGRCTRCAFLCHHRPSSPSPSPDTRSRALQKSCHTLLRETYNIGDEQLLPILSRCSVLVISPRKLRTFRPRMQQAETHRHTYRKISSAEEGGLDITICDSLYPGMMLTPVFFASFLLSILSPIALIE